MRALCTTKQFLYHFSLLSVLKVRVIVVIRIAKMLDVDWEGLMQTSRTGDRRILRSFAKPSAITVSFRKE